MSTSRKVAYNVIAASTAKILSTIAALIGVALITRYLGQEGFGLYATALAFLPFFGALGDWGIYQTTTREISRPETNEKEIVSNAMGMRLMVSIGLAIFTPIFVAFLPYAFELKIAIIIMALSYIFSSGYQTLIGLFQKRLLMDRVTFIEFISKVVQVSLIFIGVKMDLGFYFIVLTLLINMILSFIIIFLVSRKFIKFSFYFNLPYWKKFLKQSLPIGLSASVTFIYFKADTILLSLFKPPEEVGIYGAAYKVIENISFFPAMIVGLTLPMFAYNVFNNKEKFIFLVNKNFKVFLILVIPLVVGTYFLADGIIALIAGPEFAPSANVLRIIIYALAFIFFGHLFNNILIAAKLQKYLLISLSICAAFNLINNLIFIPKYSYYATSYISIATELLVVILTGFIILKKLKFFPRVNNLLAIVASGIFMFIYLWMLQDKNFFFLLFSCPLVYFGSLILMGGVSKQEIISLIKKEKPSVKK